MKKSLFFFIALVFISNISVAEENLLFYKQTIDPFWSITGHLGGPNSARNGENLNPSCIAMQKFQDGSDFQLIQDLKDGELYISLRNVLWEMNPNNEEKELQINFYDNDGKFAQALWAKYKTLNKNLIMIPRLLREKILPNFAEHDIMKIIMPDNFQNIDIILKGSREATYHFAKCVLQYGDNEEKTY